jgi:predicted double-glycine peptidase
MELYFKNPRSVSPAKLQRLVEEAWAEMLGPPSSDVVRDFPDTRQSESYDCGAACLRACAEHFGVLPPPPDRESAFIALLGTNPEDGTRPGRIVEGARRLGLDARALGGMSVDDLAAETAAGRVVICCTQQSLPEGGDGWSEGHYVTAIAVDGKSVLVQDPVDGRKRVGRGLWLRRWHDRDADGQRYERYGIVVGKAAAA